MTWRKLLSMTAVSLLPRGLVFLGGWLVVKALHRDHAEQKDLTVPSLPCCRYPRLPKTLVPPGLRKSLGRPEHKR